MHRRQGLQLERESLAEVRKLQEKSLRINQKETERVEKEIAEMTANVFSAIPDEDLQPDEFYLN